MYRRFPLLFLLVLTLSFYNCNQSFAQSSIQNAPLATTENKVKALLAKMTLQDKVGEMTQLSIDMLSVGEPYNLAKPHQLDEAKLKHVLVDLRVGSILNVVGYEYERDHWHKIIPRIQEIATKEKPTGIPILYGIDAIHGTNYTAGATLFPQQLGLAATWNPELVTQLGEVTAYETRASGIPWVFSPVLDLGRDPRWPRFWEGFGEDPMLAGIMGAALVDGYQGDDIANKYRVAACLKHFLGYSITLSGKDRSPAWVPERQLKEFVIPPFKAAMDAGAVTVMINSGEINGIPVHCNPKILKDLLRNEMGFKGIALTDWEDIKYLVSRHRVAKDHKEAIKMAINAGIDMSMVPMDLEFPVLLKELVEEGKVPMSRIDEAVTRILTVKFELGLFEQSVHSQKDYPGFAGPKHQALAYKGAVESITLLKNEKGLLPLSKNKRVLVTGPTANSLNVLNGGWSHTWQGDDPKYNTPGKLTIVEAIRKELGEGNVQYVEGSKYDKEVDIKAAVNVARSVDVAIICIGENTYTEKPGDLDDLNLPASQVKLVQEIAATGKPIILVMAQGRPRVVSAIDTLAQAALMLYLPGNEGAPALADILVGDANPSGKLPFTYPRFANTLVPYYHKGTDMVKKDFSMNAFEPQWEFGHGLSYTTYEYSNLKINSDRISTKGDLEVSVTVKNTGQRKGMEVVHLFVSDKVATITPPVKRLRGFDKVTLAPNETKVVTFKINARDLSFVGTDNKWMVEPGDFEVSVGGMKVPFVIK